MGDFLAGLRNVLGPILGQQPIAQARIGQTPIYEGASGGSDLGSTFKNLTNSGSKITLRPDMDQSPTILKHEIIHSLINKHGVDPSKLDFQDPPGQHFKDSVDPKEQISYALAGPGNTPEIKAAMEKAILSSKDVPDGFKNDLNRAGVLSQGASVPNPPQYNPNLPGAPSDPQVPEGYTIIGQGADSSVPKGYSLVKPGAVQQATSAGAPQEAPFIGRLAAQVPAIAGSMIEPGLGTAAGYSIGQLMKGASPSTFGQPDQNIGDFAKGLGVNLLTQDVAPGVLGYGVKKLLSALPAVKEGTANLLSKSLAAKFGGKTESGLLEKAAGEAQDIRNLFHEASSEPGFRGKFAPTASENTFAENTVGKQLLKLKDEADLGTDVAKSQQYKTITNQMFSDLTHVRNAKLAASPGTVAEIGYHKLLGSSEGPIDAPGILKELTGKKSEIYSEGLGENLPVFKDALSEIAKNQKIGAVGKVVNYVGNHLVWSGVAAGGAALAHPGLIAPVITNTLFSKLMSSEYAPVVVAALKTPAGSPQAAVLNQFMSAAMKSIGGAATTPEK